MARQSLVKIYGLPKGSKNAQERVQTYEIRSWGAEG